MNNGLKSEAIMKRILRKLARDAVVQTRSEARRGEAEGSEFEQAKRIAKELVP